MSHIYSQTKVFKRGIKEMGKYGIMTPQKIVFQHQTAGCCLVPLDLIIILSYTGQYDKMHSPNSTNDYK